jgi:hypothetical protein
VVRTGFALALLMTTSLVCAQSDLYTPSEFANIRGTNGLPGGGFGVTAEGEPSIRGAMAMSTPVAFSLTDWHVYVGLHAISTDLNLPDIKRQTDILGRTGWVRGMGSAFIELGVPLSDFGSATVSNHFASGDWDGGQNFHLAPNIEDLPFQVAIGVVDLNSQITGRGRRESQSHYVVATAETSEGTYVSLGKGDRRYEGLFGNVSTSLSERGRVFAEYDAFQWNYGVAYSTGPMYRADFLGKERELEGTVVFGVAAGKYLYWTFGASF